VLAVQRQLNRIGCGPVVADGVYGAETAEAVELFQSRSVDKFSSPLKVDGQVGAMTWAALFGDATLPVATTAPSPLLSDVLNTAAAEIGTMEDPPGSNRGPKVDQYLSSVGLHPEEGHYAWCAAFVYWCFQQSSQKLSIPNPVIRTAGVLDHWNRAGTTGVTRVSSQEATDSPIAVQPGMIFVLTTGSGNGHTGLVERIEGIRLTTIEGNTNQGGSREGVGVFRRDGRTIPTINRGFLLYR
jgi:hypothetical protein